MKQTNIFQAKKKSINLAFVIQHVNYDAAGITESCYVMFSAQSINQIANWFLSVQAIH